METEYILIWIVCIMLQRQEKRSLLSFLHMIQGSFPHMVIDIKILFLKEFFIW